VLKRKAIFTAETQRTQRKKRGEINYSLEKTKKFNYRTQRTRREAPGFSPGVFGTKAAGRFHRRENKEVEG